MFQLRTGCVVLDMWARYSTNEEKNGELAGWSAVANFEKESRTSLHGNDFQRGLTSVVVEAAECGDGQWVAIDRLVPVFL
jgi:hypothetical protein